MKQLVTGIVLGLILALPYGASAASGGECIDCHTEKTPGIVAYWKASRHAAEGIACARCHGGDYEKNHPSGERRMQVGATLCGDCHGEALKGHLASKHGLGFRAGSACTRNEKTTPEMSATCIACHEEGSSLPRQEVECARFLAQTPEMRRQGCLSCHDVEFRCDSCHSAHDTDLSLARNPAICAPCHMGPDHPQYEMWKTSLHGVLYGEKGVNYAPDCSTCHMAAGNHDVSRGITMGLAGQPFDPEQRDRERQTMLAVCERCHTRGFSRRNLADGDAIQKQAKSLVDEAAEIVKALDREGLLLPSPTERPPHPLSGNSLEIGPQMLYEDLSRPEVLLFRMKKFYYVITYKGVFHQNPDFAHWYGNAPLKLALSELRSEAALLRRLKTVEDRLNNLLQMGSSTKSDSETAMLKKDLRALREELLRGAISEEEFEQRKDSLLREHGL